MSDRKEVTAINRDFVKQVVSEPIKTCKFPSPFDQNAQNSPEKLHRMYRYRKFGLSDGSMMLVRTEVHGEQVRDEKRAENEEEKGLLLQMYAINEWCDRTPQANRWRQKLVNFVDVTNECECRVDIH